MSREIKFRAWDCDNHEMYTMEHMGDVDFIIENNGGMTLIICENGDMPNCHFMQYTGIKDINGAEIYEGDVVQCPGKSGLKPAAVVLVRGSFCAGPDSNTIIDDSFKVVGNVFGPRSISGKFIINRDRHFITARL